MCMKLVLDMAFIVECCLTEKKILVKHLSKMFDIYIHIFVKSTGRSVEYLVVQI